MSYIKTPVGVKTHSIGQFGSYKDSEDMTILLEALEKARSGLNVALKATNGRGATSLQKP